MRHAQIERLQALKKSIRTPWQSNDGVTDAGVVMANLEELVDILLMEREGRDSERVPPPVKGELMTPRQRAQWEAEVDKAVAIGVLGEGPTVGED